MSRKPRITSAQIRAARGLLNWSVRQLSERSGVSQSAISRAERAKGHPSMHEQGLTALKTTFEHFGVDFFEDSGVRLQSDTEEDQDRIEASSDDPSADALGSRPVIGRMRATIHD